MNVDTVRRFLKRYSFLGGFFAGLTCCHFYYKELRIDEIKDKYDSKEQSLVSRLEASENKALGLEESVRNSEDYEQRFITESSRAQTLERKYNDLVIDKDSWSRRYSDLVVMKWEEKYNAEKLSRIATQEEASLLWKRLSMAESNKPSADPELLKQLAILSNERDELRKLYVGDASSAPPIFIRGDDFEKKIALIREKRLEHLTSLDALRDQMIKAAQGFVLIDFIHSSQQHPITTKDKVNEATLEYVTKLVTCIAAINNLYLKMLNQIYFESELVLTKDMRSSMETFLFGLNKKPSALKKIEQTSAGISAIDTTQKELVSQFIRLIEKSSTDL